MPGVKHFYCVKRSLLLIATANRVELIGYWNVKVEEWGNCVAVQTEWQCHLSPRIALPLVYCDPAQTL